jgi:hypothetical protein
VRDGLEDVFGLLHLRLDLFKLLAGFDGALGNAVHVDGRKIGAGRGHDGQNSA